MFIPKDDRLRHEILGLLTQIFANSERKQFKESELAITTVDLARQLNTTPEHIRRVTSKMQIIDEIRFKEFDNGECLLAGENGYPAFSDEKYLKEGRTFVLNRVKDYLGIIVSIIAIGSAIFTAIKSISLENKNKLRIEKMQKQLDTIDARSRPQIQPKIYPVWQ